MRFSETQGDLMTDSNHDKFLRRAIELAATAALEFSSGGPFGAVIVKDNQIVAEGMNRVIASHDPTWHAEMEAIRLACITLQSYNLPGWTVATSADCCPMCLSAAYWAGIETIYYAATVGDALQYGNFDDSFIYKELALPSSQRKITMKQALREEAVAVW